MTRKQMRDVAALLGGAAFGGAATAFFFLFVTIPDLEMTRLDRVIVIVGAVVTVFAALAVHEGGHLLGGAIAGIRPYLFVVGPLKWERTATGSRLRVNRNIAFYGGIAGGVPVRTSALRQRLLACIAGGPVASLTAGAIALTVLRGTGLTTATVLRGTDAWLFTWLLVFSALSLIIGAGTLVPGRTGDFRTDGAQLLRMLRDTPESESEVAVAALVSASIAGQRPREWDPSLVARALRLPLDTVGGSTARWLAVAHAADAGRHSEARAHLQTALARPEELTAAIRSAMLLEAAQFAGLYDRNASAARQWLEKAGAATVQSSARLLAQAAVAFADSKPEMRELLDRAERALETTTDAGSAKMYADRIQQLRTQNVELRTPNAERRTALDSEF